MSSFKRIAAGASALALASGAVLAGAGFAGAQGSSEIAAGLGLAASALNGPVSVVGGAADTDGPTVTYTNKTAAAQSCAGFTMPYTSIAKLKIDPSALDLSDSTAAGQFFTALIAEGGVSVLGFDGAGKPSATAAVDATGVLTTIGAATQGEGTAVDAGKSVVWTAPTPVTPAAAVIICVPPAAGTAAPVVSFGIDKQVVVDQLNGTLPGGSIGAGSVSGGSVGAGASLLGSLGDDDTPLLGALV
ncbi:hypothetical protein BFG51_15200 [Dietzia alimentaria]|nr:hypothetical protein BFG51_15200 [Dietzia alimentaria]